MREANWDEIFQRRAEEPLHDERAESPVAFVPWEDWLTLIIVAIGFMTVVYSIDGADWVDGLPSLYPIGFTGLLAGYLLSRVRWSEWILHPIALLIGATLVFLQIIAIVPGGSMFVRSDVLVDRMYAWWSAVTQNGISSDPLPFIVLLITMTWLGAYASTWAIFRWHNPWLGLVPGGTALMWNVSFLPGQFSYSFVFFIFTAVLLVMRVNVAKRQSEWESRGVRYPEFLSLSVLHATFWVTVGLLIAVWLMPLAERSDSANERWRDFTAPVTDRLTPLARVFISVNAKRPIDVHNLENALAFQGKITLNNREAVEIDVEITPEMAAYLRAQSFDEYTSSGWKVNVTGDVPLASGERTDAPEADDAGARREITVNVTVQGNDDDLLYSLGQPVESDRDASAALGGNAEDVTSLTPAGRLRDGDTYTVTGTVAAATVEQLRAAGDEYPAWLDPYLQVPRALPDRVDRKAREVVGEAATPYDQAVAIERYLRTFPNDYDVPSTPPGRDSVDYFLFDAQRGYFDYHASAMAVMLRTLGVPARVATGYVVDPLQRQADTNLYRLTERNAFAWPEVYFPGVGWVEFSPTPSQPLINRPGTAPEGPAGSGDRGENIRPEEPIDLGINPPAQPQTETDAGAGGGAGAWPAILTLAAVGLVFAVAIGGTRLWWEYGLAGLPRPAQLWEKTQRLARWSSAGSKPSETPREYASRLRRDIDGAGDAPYIASAYERSRFGHKELSEDETEQLESAWTAVRNTLVRRVLRLKR